jgi:hypothetical protein
MKTSRKSSIIVVLVIAVSLALWLHHRNATRFPNVFTHTLDGRAVPLPAGITYLGVVEITNLAPTRLDLGSGKGCVLTPTELPGGQLQIDVVIEEQDAQGKTLRFKAPQVVTHSGQRFGISVGDICIALTPKLKI